ncbi:MAG: HAMP domain-containing protein [Candidatus Paceibacterales bacterium]
MSFKDLKIRAKLLIGFVTVALLVGVIGLVAINISKTAAEPFEEVREEFVPAVLTLEGMRQASYRMALAVHEYLLYGEERHKANFEAAATKEAAILELYEEAEAGEEAEIIESFKQEVAALTSLGRRVIQLKEQGAIQEAVSIEEEKFHGTHQAFQADLDEEITHDRQDLTRAFVRIENTIKKSRQTILFVTIFVFALAIGFGYFISRSISKPVIEIRDAAVEVAQGNMEVAITPRSNDEIGELAAAFNGMIKDLKASRAILEESKAVLEVRVEERTKELKELAQSLEEQVRQRTKELQEKIEELERFQKFAVGRELKMVELKQEIEKLKKELEKHKLT